jgi:hypothetical protein
VFEHGNESSQFYFLPFHLFSISLSPSISLTPAIFLEDCRVVGNVSDIRISTFNLLLNETQASFTPLCMIYFQSVD